MDAHLEDVICIMKYGKEGEIVVNGRKYNKPMKGNYSLTEIELAEITTYIYNTWQRKKGIIEIEYVKNALEKCPQ
jgi:cytochrome c551